MSSLPILYSFRRCPYAMRARLAIVAANRPVELREVVLRDKPAAMVEASPKATVPVLVQPDGTVIDESIDIMWWALGQNDPRPWVPNDQEERKDGKALIDLNDGLFKHALDRYKYPDRYTDEGADRTEQRERAAAILRGYEDRLRDQPWLTGSKERMADYATAPFVRQYAHVDQDWFYAQDWPHLIAWLDRFKTSDLFTRIMVRYPAWQPGDAPTFFADTTAEVAV